MLVTLRSQRVNIEGHPVISLMLFMCHPLLIKVINYLLYKILHLPQSD